MENEKRIKEIGYIDKGTGKHQSNSVFSIGGGTTHHNSRLCGVSAANDDISFCLDANYWKGTTVEQFFKKHRRQLIFEIWEVR